MPGGDPPLAAFGWGPELDDDREYFLGHRKPLDWERLGRTPASMHLVATDTADLTAHTLTGMTSVADWMTGFDLSPSAKRAPAR